ncbi:PfkB family carbohydrate kinase [Dermabacter sp. p3-SID358]|uniref:PfkB family carbohydrate kinase n=1 Tax=Dermabacter sp. p3-SID358 TaxID=2916114 RepID=UPI0021A658A1|nr:PfkB family carbohydrate kinase [Dermabacter sp. p3-SID358]MCT1867083.1 PfkB family carbohydrate kinase [Dermabacter sp. p3-SID358]
MPRVLHTAQALVDVMIEVPSLPQTGNNVNAVGIPQSYAGGAVTISLAAARVGAHAVHGGAHGEGPNGDLIRKVLRENGIGISSPAIEGKDTGSCYVFVEPSAERTFVTCYGAERDITAESLAFLAPREGDLVCVSGYSLFEPTRDPLLAFLDSLDSDVRMVLDPGAPFASFPRALRKQVLARTDVWTSNADEAREITGIDDVRGTLPALGRLLGKGAVVIVRDGSDGCYLFERGHLDYVPGYPQKAIDTNGAGDTHTGILLGERALGTPWLEAARRANAGAALKVTRKGPTTAPTREEIDDFLASNPATSLDAG